MRSGRGGRRGGAAVELALTLPLMITLICGLWEAARVVDVQQALLNAAREGGRQAATGRYSNAQVQTLTRNALEIGLEDPLGVMTQNATVTVQNINAPGADVAAATTLDTLRITVSVPFKDVRWINLPLMTNDSTILSVTVDWPSLRDAAYPTTVPSPPQG